MEKLTRTLYKKSYPASYFNPTPSAYPSYYPYSYPYPASSPYPTAFDGNDAQTDEGTYAGQSVIQTGQYHCISYPSSPGMNRNETFEIRGKRKLTLGTLRYTTAGHYYGYHDRKGLGESTSRQSAKFSVRRKTNYKDEAQSKEWKVTFI